MMQIASYLVSNATFYDFDTYSIFNLAVSNAAVLALGHRSRPIKMSCAFVSLRNFYYYGEIEVGVGIQFVAGSRRKNLNRSSCRKPGRNFGKQQFNVILNIRIRHIPQL